jgi:hypothetical protein
MLKKSSNDYEIYNDIEIVHIIYRYFLYMIMNN